MTEPANSPAVPESSPSRRVSHATWFVVAGFLVVTALFVVCGGRQWFETLWQQLPTRPKNALSNIVDVFTCCIFTWKALTVMLPAFVLGGAIGAFAPTSVILYYLGARSSKVRAYPLAAISGMLLSLCSCNIVPLFASIYRRGAGTGPAFTFLFAGPAINVVALIFTAQVIGWRIAVWRGLGVPVIAIIVGLAMAAIFKEPARAGGENSAGISAAKPQLSGFRHIWLLLGLLLLLVVWGTFDMALLPHAAGSAVLALLTALVAWKQFDADGRRLWYRETWGLIKLVIPILLPALLAIGALAHYLDAKLIYHWLGSAPESSGLLGMLRPIVVGDLFGALMYFPILSEVAFTKAFLKQGMDVGAALAILLTGAGLSLPGLFIIARAIGWVKSLVYEGLVIVLTAGYCLFFVSEFGQYICSCMMTPK